MVEVGAGELKGSEDEMMQPAGNRSESENTANPMNTEI